MNCKEAQPLFTFYLDHEIEPATRRSIANHLAGCSSCQKELAAMAAARSSTRHALQSLASAEPSPQAWEQLQNRLLKEARPSRSSLSGWISRLAPGRKSVPHFAFEGDNPMLKRLIIPALGVVLVITLVVIFLARGATPVSAQQILDRASAAQSAGTFKGIQHIRVDTYQNLKTQTGAQAGQNTSIESYLDFETGYMRWVVTNTATHQVIDAFAYDGTYTYSSKQPADGTPTGPLTIYRVPQSPDKLADLQHSGPGKNARQMFDMFRSDANVELKQETQADGRLIYSLTSAEPAKTVSGNSAQVSMGLTTMIFDAQTYQLLEIQSQIRKDGQDVLISTQRYVANEILPAGTRVSWDLSDVTSVSILDDPRGLHGDLLPEIISQSELSTHVKNAYVLKMVPDGFSEEITAAPNQPANQPFVYVVAYRKQDGNYFVLQPTGEVHVTIENSSSSEPYTTASGLVVQFTDTLHIPEGKDVTAAVLTVPDGTTFDLNSTLSREQIKALAENLVQSLP